MDSRSGKDIAFELAGIIRLYKDGSVERLFGSPHVPPSPEDPQTGVSSKDVTISRDTGLAARLFLPKLTSPSQKLPILVYYHAGGFCIESAFSLFDHRYANIVSSQAQVIVVSVEYRQAPEHPLPTAYEDCWVALQWVASNSHSQTNGPYYEPWLANHGDFDAIFLGGDSAGGNISHNIAMRAGDERLPHGVKILGAFMSHSYFLGSKWFQPKLDMAFKMWEFVYPDVPGGADNPLINPVADGAPSLAKLGCSRALVLVAGNDDLRDLGVEYFNAVKESGYGGKVELFEVEGEGHAFHLLNPDTENAKLMFKRLASFLQK
ncbi:hypothetical protein Ancab_013388 [Ancistrocladus abbreviatus]